MTGVSPPQEASPQEAHPSQLRARRSMARHPTEEALKRLNTGRDGLSAEEAAGG